MNESQTFCENGSLYHYEYPGADPEIVTGEELASTFEVVVGNVGTVYRGTDAALATKTYDEYVEISKSGVGRAGNEPVTLFHDGEPIKEHQGEVS